MSEWSETNRISILVMAASASEPTNIGSLALAATPTNFDAGLEFIA